MNNECPDLLENGPSDAEITCILAHGAGAAMDTPFMNTISDGLADHGIHVVRFEFPYMAERRRSGKRRGPDRPPVLMETWHQVVAALRPRRLVIGGKSMGGRIATMVADNVNVAGVVCLGYPFHPVGKPDQLRIEHLQNIITPTLIIQGQRDPFGTESEVTAYSLGDHVELCWLTDGEHSFKPRKASGVTEDENLASAVDVASRFIAQL